MSRGLIVLSLLALFGTGCGPDRPKTVRVSGQVKFAGGPPPVPGTVFFAAIEAAPGFPLRSASGSFDGQGHLQVTTYKEGDGLVPGRYQMKVECWKTPPNENSPGVSYVPSDFLSGVLEVPADGSKPALVELDVPKNW